jgi:hypothetical protein
MPPDLEGQTELAGWWGVTSSSGVKGLVEKGQREGYRTPDDELSRKSVVMGSRQMPVVSTG